MRCVNENDCFLRVRLCHADRSARRASGLADSPPPRPLFSVPGIMPSPAHRGLPTELRRHGGRSSTLWLGAAVRPAAYRRCLAHSSGFASASVVEASPPAPSSWLGFASSSASNRENAKRVSYGDVTLYIAALPVTCTERRSVRELAAPPDDACGVRLRLRPPPSRWS